MPPRLASRGRMLAFTLRYRAEEQAPFLDEEGEKDGDRVKAELKHAKLVKESL